MKRGTVCWSRLRKVLIGAVSSLGTDGTGSTQAKSLAEPL